MDKSAIERFSINARIKLRDSVDSSMAKLGFGPGRGIESIQSVGDTTIITLPGGIQTKISNDEARQREKLADIISKEGYDNVVEKIAYTWFNRLIAVRYMEVNDFLPTHVRVLSSNIPDKIEPDIVSQCLTVDLDITEQERETIKNLRDSNRLDELFSKMFIFECKSLNKILPELFTITKPYENMLLNISYTNPDGVVRSLVDDVPEDDFRDAVQIIGWMYQYYNSELKDETFANLKKNVKIPKERIPAATQLFTPDWIVRYMVENSIGRVWIEGHNDQSLKSSWEYYIDDADQEPEIAAKLNKIYDTRSNITPLDIKVIDPCMGSGHILVYAFDVLMQIYLRYGYSRPDAAEMILTNNLYGLDIDDRAYQLAYFAIMMKAREHDPNLFQKNIQVNLYSFSDSIEISKEMLDCYGCEMDEQEKKKSIVDLNYLLSSFYNSKSYGSLLHVRSINWIRLESFVASKKNSIYFDTEVDLKIHNTISIAKVLAGQYDAVITNPPYSKKSSLCDTVRYYLEQEYANFSSDLYSAFIKRCYDFAKENAYVSMITQSSFTFKSYFKKTRTELRKLISFNNFVRLGPGTFDSIGGEVVQSVAFTFIKNPINTKIVYVDLFDIKKSENKRTEFINNKSRRTIKSGINNDQGEAPLFKQFDLPAGMKITAKIGSQPGSNLIHYWWEVDLENSSYIPYNKGGKYCKWYGNQLWVLKYGIDGSEVIKNKGQLSNKDYYFKPMISWTRVSSKLNMRYYPEGFGFDNTSPAIFNDLFYLIGYYNSDVCEHIRLETYAGNKIELGHITALAPIMPDKDTRAIIEKLSKENIELSKEIWDYNELSWNYVGIQIFQGSSLEDAYNSYVKRINEITKQLNSNQYQIDQIFSKIYNISVETSETRFDTTLSHYITQFISFFVGCVFKRYPTCLNGTDLTFKPSLDNIVLINDSEYLGTDIVSKFIEFVECVFGKDNLEINLKFIAKGLTGGNGSSREKIRNYFLNVFYKEHLKTYFDSPIYWLFDSGSANGFKALVYIHNYTPDLISKMRQDYLLPLQRRYSEQLKIDSDPIICSRLENKLEEISTYDLAMELYSSNKVSINLDEGIKANYAKFQNIDNPGGRGKINLLYKIE